ncbi:MAG: hypothetical protein NTNFB02_09590 [Nitrospira sp.]
MDGDIVLLAHGDSHSSLCMDRAALEGMAFRQHENTTGSAQFQGRAKAGDPAADDEKIS